jgi:hypothetical protein
MLPERWQIEDMLHAAGLSVRYYSDDSKLGYLLKACPMIGGRNQRESQVQDGIDTMV